MINYTPAPWHASPDAVPEAYSPQITIYAEADGNRVATVFRTEANADLIAAAPELLEALKELLDASGLPYGSSLYPLAVDHAREIIARAEGGTDA